MIEDSESQGIPQERQENVYSLQDVKGLSARATTIYVRYLNLVNYIYPTTGNQKTLLGTGFRRIRGQGRRIVDKVRRFTEFYQQVLQQANVGQQPQAQRGRQQWFYRVFQRNKYLNFDHVDLANIPNLAELSTMTSTQARVTPIESDDVNFLRARRFLGQDFIAVQRWLVWQKWGHDLRANDLRDPQPVLQLLQAGDSWPFSIPADINPASIYTILGRLLQQQNAIIQGQAKLQVSFTAMEPISLDLEADSPPQRFVANFRLLLFPVLYYIYYAWMIAQAHEEQVVMDKAKIANLQGWGIQQQIRFFIQPSQTQGYKLLGGFDKPNLLRMFLERARRTKDWGQAFMFVYMHTRVWGKQYWAFLKQRAQSFQDYMIDAQGHRGLILRVANMVATTKVQTIVSLIQPLSFPSTTNRGEYRQFLAILNPFKQPPALKHMLDWTFYAKHRRALVSQFVIENRTCVQVFNKHMEERGLPPFVPGDTQHLLAILQYAQQWGFGINILGFKQYSTVGDRQQTVFIGPRHIQLERPVKTICNKKVISRFIPAWVTQKQARWSQDYYQLSRPQIWKIGEELPLDPEISLPDQKKLRQHCLVIDIEALATSGQRQTPYMICAVGYPYQNGQILYRCWSNTQYETYQIGQPRVNRVGQLPVQTCLWRFAQWLAQIVNDYSKKDPLVLWGYNMMGYELVYLLKVLTVVFGKVEMTGSPTECKTFSVGQGAIVFADVLKILQPQKLSKASKQFGLVIKKGQLNIAEYKTWQSVGRDYQKIKQYCYYDCVSTLLLLHKLQVGFMTIARMLSMPFTTEMISRKFTASGIGWLFFVQGFLKRGLVNNQQKDTNQATFYNSQPQEVYRYQRSSYTGGVVQVFRYVWEQKTYVVDINSMYPFITLRDMPWQFVGQGSKTQLNDILGQLYSDMYLFEVTAYQLPAGFLGAFLATKQLFKSDKNTYYNSYQGDPIYIRGVVLRRLRHHRGFVSFARYWQYSPGTITALKQFSSTFYQQRLQTDSTSMKTCYKLLMNSVIGRFSMSQKTGFQTTVAPVKQDYHYIDQDYFLQSSKSQLPAVGRLVRITAYITDCAKVYLDELAQKAGYQNVLYCDTDSLMCTEQGYKNLGSPGTKASKLGQFKCQKPPNSSHNYYSAGYFKNRKDYILKYVNDNMEVDYLYKAKGIPKRFITRQFTQVMVDSFLRLLPGLLNQPAQTKFSVGTKVTMQVWRKKFGDQFGVNIQQMQKSSSVIVDRFFPDVRGVGIPWSPANIMIL